MWSFWYEYKERVKISFVLVPPLGDPPYNVITFQTETYEEVAKLNVDPIPDTVVRVNMLFYGSDEYVEIEEQDLTSMNPSLSEREGFVLVEWGGGIFETR